VKRSSERLGGWIRERAWPIGIAAIIATFFVADGMLIATAFSDEGFAPEEDYYEKALHHDEVQAALRRAQSIGLRMTLTFAEAPLQNMPRRVDVRITDQSGRPVTGLTGTLTAVRPADARLRNQAELVSVPGEDGLYRLLLRLPAPGLWVFELDARQGSDVYRVVSREDVRI